MEVGDVNNDNLLDLIIGAPYDEKVGSIYIIYGFKN